jgi:hypothetical protein
LLKNYNAHTSDEAIPIEEYMNPKNNKDKQRSSQSKDLSDKELCEQLAQCLAYVAKLDAQEGKEPIEAYTKSLKIRFHRRGQQFKEKFSQGYEILIRTLHSMKP